jgi:glycosyltransferase involved in cell wall biosynthesis
MSGQDSLCNNFTTISATGKPLVRYCIITAARDEERFLADTIESVVLQTIRPIEWIIVNDGSKDSTSTIIERYASKYSWIRCYHRKDRGFRSPGGGVEAFLDVYPEIQSSDWEYLVNLDADLTFAPDYFEKCFEYFHRMPKLGIGGGTIYDKVGDSLKLEKSPQFHVRGATKIYRRECWDIIGGLQNGVGWDTVDEIKANQLGWITKTFLDISLVQHRVTGGAWGAWENGVIGGSADYIVDYHPLFFGLKCIRNLFQPPYLVRGLARAYGYCSSFFRRTPKIGDTELRRYLRDQQLRRILGRASIWE